MNNKFYYILLIGLILALPIAAQDARNYGLTDGTFSTGTNESLVDMSTGTTTLISGGVTDGASSVASIGFDVWFMGERYTQFSVGTNGIFRFGGVAVNTGSNTPAIAGQARIAPVTSGSFTGETVSTGYFQTNSSTGKVHYKVIGSEPNRILVVEWKDMEIGHRSLLSSYATFQAHVYETAPAPTTTDGGVIKFVYGSLPTDARDASNTQRDITTRTGIGSGNTLGEYLTVITEGASAVSATTTDNDAASGVAYLNTLTAGSDIPNLHSPTASSRRYITFAAPDVTGVPSNTNASCITNTTIEIEWLDPSTTNGYNIVIYRSTDGTNYDYLTHVPIGTEDYEDTGLTSGATYYYRLYVANEGKLSQLGSEASITVGTLTGATVAYAVQSGDWNSGSTWSTGTEPVAGTDVVIGCGYTVTITNAGEACNSLEVLSGASLAFSDNTDLTINGNFINAGTANFSGTNVSVDFNGDITNSGSWDSGTSTMTMSGTSAQNISNTGTAAGGSVVTSNSVSYGFIAGFNVVGGGRRSLTFNITDSHVATDIDFELDIDHSYVGDMDIFLENPSGTRVQLLNGPLNGAHGCSEDDLSATFNDEGTDGAADSQCSTSGTAISGDLTPTSPLSAFDGASINGSWRLDVDDIYNDMGVDGRINNLSLNVTYNITTSTTLSHIAFYNLIINNTSTGVTTNDTITIINDMDLTDGIVNVSGHEVIFLDDATTEVGSNDSHVSGQIRKIGDDAFHFPIGNGTYVAQCGISAPVDATEEFTATYTRQNPASASYFPLATDGTVNNVSKVEYWDIDRAVGSSSVAISLSYNDTRSEGVQNPDSLVIVHWDGTQWDNQGNSATFTNPYDGITAGMVTGAFSPFTLGNIATSADDFNLLPVTLTSFIAERQEEEVLLSWKTSSEINSDYFEVERSFDGKTFSAIGRVEAQGESKVTQSYSLLDDDAEISSYPVVYYRLKMVDRDESFGHSTITQVNFEVENDFKLLTAYPNPFSQDVTIRFTASENGTSNWKVTDLLGRTVQTYSVDTQTGFNEYSLGGLNQLPKGTYILSGIYQGKKATFKLVKN